MLAPLTLGLFHGAAWLGPLVNLVAVPVMAVLTPLVLAAVALVWTLPGLGEPTLLAIAQLLSVFQQALAELAAHAPQPWIPAAPPAAALLLALLGALLLFAPRGWPGRGLGLMCFLPLLLPPVQGVRGPFELTAVDVGQGLSLLVRTPTRALLYDAGPAFEDGFDAGESVVPPYVLGLGLRGVDRLVLSHGDRDHADGMPAVRRLVRVRDEMGTQCHAPCREGRPGSGTACASSSCIRMAGSGRTTTAPACSGFPWTASVRCSPAISNARPRSACYGCTRIG